MIPQTFTRWTTRLPASQKASPLLVACAALLFATVTVPTVAEASPVCRIQNYWERKAFATAAAGAAGIPAYLSEDARLSLQGEANTLGPQESSTERPGLGLGASISGAWGRHGYRIDWFDIQPGGDSCSNYPGYWSFTASYEIALLHGGPTEFRAALGGGVGGLPHEAYSLSIGATLEHRISEGFLVSGRLRYLPNHLMLGTFDRSEELSAGRRIEHAVRARARLQWRLLPGFQPHVSLLAGLHDEPGATTAEEPLVGGRDDDAFGGYVGGLVGFESRWSSTD